ncbi:hypothetical protein BDR04DRAFT_1119224 [Suillus decipiens]|nr:hypothetical protein BDR04DRAFT_1119224 [Suillus decipiens]
MFMHYQWGLGVGNTYTHTSHKYPDTTATFEDLEEEEVDFDQDQGEDFEDKSVISRKAEQGSLIVSSHLLIFGSGTDYQQQQYFIIMEHSAFHTRSQTRDVSGEGVQETSNLETSCHQLESFNTQYSFHSPSQAAGGNSGLLLAFLHNVLAVQTGKDATIFDWFSHLQHIAETLEGTFLSSEDTLMLFIIINWPGSKYSWPTYQFQTSNVSLVSPYLSTAFFLLLAWAANFIH